MGSPPVNTNLRDIPSFRNFATSVEVFLKVTNSPFFHVCLESHQSQVRSQPVKRRNEHGDPAVTPSPWRTSTYISVRGIGTTLRIGRLMPLSVLNYEMRYS